jgi:hypothetical protein
MGLHAPFMHTPPFTEVDALITDGFPQIMIFFIEMLHLRRQMLRLWTKSSVHFEGGPVVYFAYTC